MVSIFDGARLSASTSGIKSREDNKISTNKINLTRLNRIFLRAICYWTIFTGMCNRTNRTKARRAILIQYGNEKKSLGM